MSTGIGPIDRRLGGFLPGRIHVLSGAPGSGKSLACLGFLNAGLERGEQVALLTHDDPGDLLAQGKYLGLDLETALREERFALLRYQLDFAGRFGRTPNPSVAFDELRRLLGGCTPRRIAIDSIAPIVESGTAAGGGLAALLEFLDGCTATSLLTYPGEFGGRYDRRLEPIMQRAAAVLHLATEREHNVLTVQKVRYSVTSTTPVPYVVRAGAGLQPIDGGRRRRADDVAADSPRRVLLLLACGDCTAPDELVRALQTSFDVTVRSGDAAAADAAAAGVVLVHSRRDGFDDALLVVRGLRERGVVAPIAVASSSTLRAVDRTRALRAGADDFLDADLRLEELLLRLERLARLGRSSALPAAIGHADAATDAGGVLDEREFRGVVQARVRTSAAAFFTLVRLRPTNADATAVSSLADAACLHLRAGSGDLAGRLDGSVAVVLESARRKDVDPFVSRLRAAWRDAGGGDLDVETIAFPAEQDALRRMLEEPAA